MGAVAFLMAAFTEISYTYICVIAFVPALMYYFQCYMSVHFRSGLMDIKGISRNELPGSSPSCGRRDISSSLYCCSSCGSYRALPLRRRLWAMALAVFLGFFREDTRIVGLPPVLAAPWGSGGGH